MGLEIEKKFLLPGFYSFLSLYKPCEIEQAYISFDPVIRIRKADDSYILTYKSSGLLCRKEYNIDIDEREFSNLSRKVEGTYIKKKRYKLKLIEFLEKYLETDCTDGSKKEEIKSYIRTYRVEYADLFVETDIFEGDLAGLILAEIEFDNIELARSFTAPSCLGREVTDDKKYQNSNMARQKV